MSLLQLQPSGHDIPEAWLVHHLRSAHQRQLERRERSESWTVPLGGGIGKIFSMGKQKMGLSLEGDGNVVQPDNGPDALMIFTFILLFPE